MRIIDIVLAFPFLVLMLAIIAVLGPGLGSFYIAMALVGWVSYARLIRAQVLTLKQRDFVLAARSLGYGHPRILFRHLLPNALSGAIVFRCPTACWCCLTGPR
jgi:peptide/nickel transport system permease protein